MGQNFAKCAPLIKWSWTPPPPQLQNNQPKLKLHLSLSEVGPARPQLVFCFSWLKKESKTAQDLFDCVLKTNKVLTGKNSQHSGSFQKFPGVLIEFLGDY